jgi:hypothetical protein
MTSIAIKISCNLDKLFSGMYCEEVEGSPKAIAIKLN